MSRSYYHRRHRKDFKTPPYYIRLCHQKPARRAAKVRLNSIVKGADPDSVDLHLEDFLITDYWL